MVIHDGYDDLNFLSPVVTIGVFDGVHRGHRSLLDVLVSRAGEYDSESVVITFDPHPRTVLQKESRTLYFLTTFAEKARLLEEAGVGHLVIIDFSRDFSNMEACDFVQKILAGRLHAKHLVIGYDHHFGKSGKGNFELIRECARTSELTVEQVKGVRISNTVISSTAIRIALLEGRLDDANEMLGYNYFLNGTVIEGRKIGRSLGFPTANIRPDDECKLIPADGVYAVMVGVEGEALAGMLSIGKNPTVTPGDRRSVEVHIIDFNRDIYGKNITVTFRKRLRNEIRFESPAQLAKQMNADREQTLRILS
jgi:riboflavin kinase/FMN adenylyltransferase